MIKDIEHIIWDWNVTLFNDVELSKNIMNRMLSKRDKNLISLERYRTIFTFHVIEYYKKTGLDLSVDTFEELSTEFISDYETNKIN